MEPRGIEPLTSSLPVWRARLLQYPEMSENPYFRRVFGHFVFLSTANENSSKSALENSPKRVRIDPPRGAAAYQVIRA